MKMLLWSVDLLFVLLFLRHSVLLMYLVFVGQASRSQETQQDRCQQGFQFYLFQSLGNYNIEKVFELLTCLNG